MRRNRQSGIGLLLAAAVFTAGVTACGHPDDARVRVTYDGQSGAPAIEDVTVHVGGSKFWWATLKGGTSDDVRLSPQGDLPDPWMNYTIGGIRRSWQGPSIPRGKGYAIDIKIAADGKVTERHCLMPCSLR